MTKRDKVLAALRTQDRMTSQQVADALGIGRQAALYHLNLLVQEGKASPLGRGLNGGYTAVKTARRSGVETDRKILDLLSDQGPLTSVQIADALDMTQTAVAQRLHKLQTEGKIIGERTGANRGYRLAEVKPYTKRVTKSLAALENGDIAYPDLKNAILDDPAHFVTHASREELVETVNVLSDKETMDAITQAETASISDETKSFFEQAAHGLFGNSNVDWSAAGYPQTKPTVTSDASTVEGITVTGPSGNNLISVSSDMFDRVKNLPFAVGVAAVALLNNDVQTAKRMLSLT